MMTYDGLNPVDSAGREEHEVTGALHEAVDGHLMAREFVQIGPPGAGQEVHAVPIRVKSRVERRIEHSFHQSREHTGMLEYSRRDSKCTSISRRRSLSESRNRSVNQYCTASAGTMGILVAESVEHAPIRLGHTVPLAFAGAHVDVDGARVVVLLVAGRAAARHFHVQLNAVHSCITSTCSRTVKLQVQNEYE